MLYTIAVSLAWSSGVARGETVVADSATDWSETGTQGELGWTYGFYDRSGDGDRAYQAGDFTPFQNSCGADGRPCPLGGEVAPDGNHWLGPVPTNPGEPGNEPRWDLMPGFDPPWTRLGREALHPNGLNSGPEHWVVRRWECDVSRDALIRWRIRKQVAGGTGITGHVFVTHGSTGSTTEVDSATIGGGDLEGVERLVKVALAAGDLVDLAVSAAGTDGASDGSGDSSSSGFAVVEGSLNSPLALRPNIVFILIDDAGIGDFPVYVSSSPVSTPRIDALAAGGMRFTRAYAGSTVCAPSRSTLLSGYHTGHTWIRDNFNTAGIRDRDLTLAEILRAAGYATGGFGKWGLASPGTAGAPERQGFDSYLGPYHQVHAHTHYCDRMYSNGEPWLLRENIGFSEPGTGLVGSARSHSFDRTVEAMREFIADQARSGDPFFVYGAWNPPHTHSVIPEDDPAWELYSHESWSLEQRIQAAMISIIDRHVGDVLDTLSDPNGDGRHEDSVLEDTLVIFTSDNGGTSNVAYARNGLLRGGKTSLFEGGLRVPLIASWPGRIPAGSTSDLLTYFPDFLPTFAQLAGADDLIPLDVDGVSIAPTLLESGAQLEHEALYFEYYGGDPNRAPDRAVRWGDWKMILSRGETVELYDLESDPRESGNVASANPSVVSRIREIMEAEHQPMRPQFNVNPPTVGNASKDGVVTFGIRPPESSRAWTASLSGDARSLSGTVIDPVGGPVRLFLDDLDVRYVVGLEGLRSGISAPILQVLLRGASGVVYFQGTFDTSGLVPGVPTPVLLELEVTSTTPSAEDLGGDRNQPLRLELSHDGGAGELSASVRFLRGDCWEGDAPCGIFRRADCNDDGRVDLSDAVSVLLQLFLGGEPPPCRDACDANDDGVLDLSDAVYTLSSLFAAGSPPPPPYPGCGVDPTADDVDCGASGQGCTS